SLAFRLNTRTRSPSRRQTKRNPSCLISKAQRAPSGTTRASVGRHGSMKPAGRAGEGECTRVQPANIGRTLATILLPNCVVPTGMERNIEANSSNRSVQEGIEQNE